LGPEKSAPSNGAGDHRGADCGDGKNAIETNSRKMRRVGLDIFAGGCLILAMQACVFAIGRCGLKHGLHRNTGKVKTGERSHSPRPIEILTPIEYLIEYLIEKLSTTTTPVPYMGMGVVRQTVVQEQQPSGCWRWTEPERKLLNESMWRRELLAGDAG
jgi:hypothetical protein